MSSGEGGSCAPGCAGSRSRRAAPRVCQTRRTTSPRSICRRTIDTISAPGSSRVLGDALALGLGETASASAGGTGRRAVHAAGRDRARAAGGGWCWVGAGPATGGVGGGRSPCSGFRRGRLRRRPPLPCAALRRSWRRTLTRPLGFGKGEWKALCGRRAAVAARRPREFDGYGVRELRLNASGTLRG